MSRQENISLKEKEQFIIQTKIIAVDKLKNVNTVIEITGNEFEGLSLEEKRENAHSYFENNFRNKDFYNKDWKKYIKVLSGKKTFNNTADTDKINTFKYLDIMLENAVYLRCSKEEKNRSNIKNWHYLAIKVKSKKEENNDNKWIVIFSVREDNNGNIYYNHSINKEETEPTTDSLLKCEGFSSVCEDIIPYKTKKVNIYFVGN